MYFQYGDNETAYLKRKDKALGEVIEKIGPIEREVDNDLFSSVVHHIIGQQISTKAQATVWRRMKEQFGEVTVESVMAAEMPELQSLGMTFRKAEYIKDFAGKVQSGAFNLEGISRLPDGEAIRTLASLKGIGIWTAEMILLFCLQRPNIFSFDDLAIQRGLRMVYHHRKIDRKLFEKYRRRFSPYCSVASLYLWAVAGGAVPGMKDYAPKKGEIVERIEQINAVRNRDKRYDGKFFVAVTSTKIVCRPSCSAKMPLEKNMAFYGTFEEALAEGYRPCKVCKPETIRKKE